MELTPENIAHNTLKFFLDGLEEPVFFSVTAKTARKVTHTLMFGPEDEDNEPTLEDPFLLDFPLQNGHWAYVSMDHIVLAQHLFDYGTPSGVPPEGHYGRVVNPDLAEQEQWYHPQIALGVRGYGTMRLVDQSASEMSMLRDTMVEGFPVSRFLDFIDDDGEQSIIPYDRFIFAVFEPELLP